ncbi:Ig-like domain-containing protein [Actinoplanes derwentensis]|uniref:Ig-like domain (Group 3) n=1 Tax=Actinoplanes derwentensis TaxID=113562 RepID=A0A1H2CXD2_9ACTN|nr:Ig-like domain-containing protein [Actinoplanes derwentensis]GID87896.1 hypothetical protein Ade03nite_68200 [Actinoplanes derwentensis]SDT74947.1 Ig-like domain (group 3) [Actinoplanes derwentensis]
MRHRAVILSTVLTLAVSATLASPAQAAAGVVVDLGIAPGTRINKTVELLPTLADDTGVTRVSLSANNGIVASATAKPWRLRWDTSAIADQDVQLKLIVRIGDAETTSDPVIVRVDNYAPLADFPRSWGNSSQYQGSSNSFTGTVAFNLTPRNDAATVRRIDLLVGDTIIDTATAAPWPVTWDTTTLPEGSVRLFTRTYDDLGNVTRNTAALWVDRSAPTVAIRFPVTTGVVSRGAPLLVEASDPAGVERAELWAGNRLVRTDRTLASSGTGTAELPLDAAVPNGPVTITVKVYDNLGNVAEQTRTVTVDNDKPVATGTPASTYLRGTVTAGLTGLRESTGLITLGAFLDDHSGTGGYVFRSPWTVRVNSRAAADGKHVLNWYLTDKAGNTTHLRRTVYVDNTAPTVRYLKAPKNKAKLSGTIKITAKAADKYGVSRVQLLVNGKVVATDSKAGYAFTLNPKKYGKSFTVQIRAYDRAGNVKHTAKRTYRR